MAVTSPGAQAPNSPASLPTSQRTPQRVIQLSTRTRVCRGVFLLGTELVTVYSSRRAADDMGVTMSIGNDSQILTGNMTSSVARALASALVASAAACEAQGGAA